MKYAFDAVISSAGEAFTLPTARLSSEELVDLCGQLQLPLGCANPSIYSSSNRIPKQHLVNAGTLWYACTLDRVDPCSC